MEIPLDIQICLMLLACLPVIFGFLLFLEYKMTKNDGPIITRTKKESEFYDSERSEYAQFPSIDDPGSVSLSVIVPAYNEEQRLPAMLDEAVSFLNTRKANDDHFSYEIIIVDDGSKDATTAVGLEYTAKYGADTVRVLTLENNRGKGGAIRLGVLSARGARILMADADGATRFSDISKLEAGLEEVAPEQPPILNAAAGDGAVASRNQLVDNIEDLRIAIGSRAHLEKDAIAQRSIFRTFLMKGFHMCVRVFGNVKDLRDTQCGFKLFTRPAAYYTFKNLHVERWAFDVELMSIAQHLDIPIAEVAVNWQEIEGSKLTPFWSWLQMGADLLLIRVHYLLLAWKVVFKPAHCGREERPHHLKRRGGGGGSRAQAPQPQPPRQEKKTS